MSQRFIASFAAAVAFLPLAGCVGGGAIQPDRSVFSLDGNYQRCQFGYSIEETFDRTVKVFKESGYHLDVVDRATGQISGERGNTGANTASTDKGLKFYALILPTSTGQSQVGVKIVQIIERGAVFNKSKTEIIVADSQMYQYLFRRIGDIDMLGGNGSATTTTTTTTPTPQRTPAWDSYGAQPKSYTAPAH